MDGNVKLMISIMILTTIVLCSIFIVILLYTIYNHWKIYFILKRNLINSNDKISFNIGFLESLEHLLDKYDLDKDKEKVLINTINLIDKYNKYLLRFFVLSILFIIICCLVILISHTLYL